MPATLAANASCAGEEGGWVLTLESGHFQLMHKRHEDRIRGAIQAILGENVAVTFREGNPGAQTPVAYQEQQGGRAPRVRCYRNQGRSGGTADSGPVRGPGD